MKYLLLGKIIPSNSTMVGEKVKIHILNSLRIHEKYMKYLLLGKIIPSNSIKVGKFFENSYPESLNNASKIHEILIIRQDHSF